MAFVKWVLIAVVALVVLFLVVGLFLPSTAHVERSIVINAPQATIFALGNGFARYNEWSPWAAIDPTTTYTYEGPSCGPGAMMIWQSDHKEVGSGSQEVVESTPWEEVKTHLDFGEQGTAEAFFRLTPSGEGVELVWGFDTDFGYNLLFRWVGLGFDSMIGASYEEGLLSLKKLAESLPQNDWGELEISVIEVEPLTIAAASGRCPHKFDLIGPALAEAYGKVGAFMAKNKLEKAGMPVVINHEYKIDYVFDAGIPVANVPDPAPAADADVIIKQTPGGRMIKAVHIGSYRSMGATYGQLKAYAAVHGLDLVEPAWEQYVSDPGDTPEAELITHIYYPIG